MNFTVDQKLNIMLAAFAFVIIMHIVFFLKPSWFLRCPCMRNQTRMNRRKGSKYIIMRKSKGCSCGQNCGSNYPFRLREEEQEQE